MYGIVKPYNFRMFSASSPSVDSMQPAATASVLKQWEAFECAITMWETVA